jgi:hypothetical protein
LSVMQREPIRVPVESPEWDEPLANGLRDAAYYGLSCLFCAAGGFALALSFRLKDVVSYCVGGGLP